MIKKFLKFSLGFFWTSVSLVLLAPQALATFDPNKVYPPDVGLPGGKTSSINTTIVDIISKILLPIVGIIAVLFVIVGGIQYMTAGLNEEQAEMGKKTFQNAIIGLVIVIMSYMVVVVIFNALDKLK